MNFTKREEWSSLKSAKRENSMKLNLQLREYEDTIRLIKQESGDDIAKKKNI